jgi:hypothetical protein
MNRQRLILFVLVILLLAAVISIFFRMPRQQKVATLTHPPGSVATSPRGKNVQAPSALKVRTDLLTVNRSGFSGYRKNIFLSLAEQEAAQARRKAERVARAVRALPPPPPPPFVPPPPPPPPPSEFKRETSQLTFLGLLKKDNRQTVFVSRNNEILLVRPGEKLMGKFDVVEVSENAITFNVPSEGGRVVVPLTENRALTPVKR